MRVQAGLQHLGQPVELRDGPAVAQRVQQNQRQLPHADRVADVVRLLDLQHHPGKEQLLRGILRGGRGAVHVQQTLIHFRHGWFSLIPFVSSFRFVLFDAGRPLLRGTVESGGAWKIHRCAKKSSTHTTDL